MQTEVLKHPVKVAIEHAGDKARMLEYHFGNAARQDTVFFFSYFDRKILYIVKDFLTDGQRRLFVLDTIPKGYKLPIRPRL